LTGLVLTMGKFDNLSKDALDKKYKAHLKSKKSRPSEQSYQDKDRKIKESINSYKLRLAELKYENEQIRTKTDALLATQSAMRADLTDAQKELDSYKQERKQIQQELISSMGNGGKGPRRIKDPSKRLAEYEAEFRKQKHRLNCEEVSTGEEKKIMRNIKILENNIAEVKKYMSKNVEEVFVKKDQKQKKVDEFRGHHQKVYEKFSNAKQEATAGFESLDENKKEQTKIQELITKLLEQRKQAESDYKASWDAYEQWQRTERELKIARNAKQYDEDVESAPSSDKKSKKSDAKAAAAKKEAEAEKAKREEAEEQLKSVEDRRAAAVAAYKQCRDNLKNKSKTPVAGEDPVAIPDMSMEKADDPHQAEKDLCRSLIAYCQSNLPSSKDSPAKGKKKKRKKKKKIRLTHKPISFSNFAKVGVGIPIWSTDLEACIKSLEDKITSYDNLESEEEVKESSTSV